MKHFILLLTLLIYSFKQTKANKIDSLKTDKDVESFITSLVKQKYDCRYCKYQLAKPDSVNSYLNCDSTIVWESNIWQKTDFNNDGLTDLFAIIYQQDTVNSRFPEYQVYVVIDQKNNKYQLNEIPNYYMFNCYSAKLIVVNNYPCILYRHYNTDYTIDTLPGVDTTYGEPMPRLLPHYFEVGRTDTLIYKFGGFIELNATSKNLTDIKSLYYETTPCFDSCPKFSLNILRNGTAKYIRHENLSETSRNFRAKINTTQWNEITALLNYMQIESLENNYSVSAHDMQSCKLKVYFSNGSIKEINDYGLQGTLGLVRLYDLLFALRLNQKWR
jgi:hypothetical protein